MQYKSQSARDAQEMSYGDKSYWDYLDREAQELYDYYMAEGDEAAAQRMLTRSLGEALKGNEGD